MLGLGCEAPLTDQRASWLLLEAIGASLDDLAGDDHLRSSFEVLTIDSALSNRLPVLDLNFGPQIHLRVAVTLLASPDTLGATLSCFTRTVVSELVAAGVGTSPVLRNLILLLIQVQLWRLDSLNVPLLKARAARPLSLPLLG